MGVESDFYILPDSSGFRPTAAKVCELATQLRAAGYICDPQSPSYEPSAHGCPPRLKGLPNYEGFDWQIEDERGVGSLSALERKIANLERSDIKLCWPNANLAKSGLKYPLAPAPDSDGIYYDIEFHLPADTVYCTSEIIDPFDEPIHCSCGGILKSFDGPASDFFYSARLPNLCPACRKVTNYSALPFTMHDGWTGEESEQRGGITYRFCVVVDCGKMIPERGAAIVPGFREIIEQCMGCTTRVVQDFY